MNDATSTGPTIESRATATSGQTRARRLRFALWTCVALALLLALGYAFRPQPVLVDLSVAVRGPLATTIDEEGETRVRDVHVISAPVGGRMLRIEVEPGDEVVANETILAQIEPRDPAFLDLRTETQARAAIKVAEAANAFAKAELAQAHAEHEFAAAEFRRMQRLRERDTVSERAFEDARRVERIAAAAVDTARAGLSMRESELERARAELLSPVETQDQHGVCECVPVRASTSGKVLRVLHESEGVVSAGEPLLELGDPTDVEVLVELLSTEAVRLRPGLEVRIEGWGGEQPLHGQVRRVEPYGFTKVSALGIEEQRVNVLIDPSDDRASWASLGHGFRVEARILTWQAADVLKIPATALFRKGDDWWVFVVDEGRARERQVSVAHRTAREVEVLAGLDDGDPVVTFPNDRIADGVRVAARPATP